MEEVIHIEFRNAVYYGPLKEGELHGRGLLITDTSCVIVAQWKNNYIDGPYAIISANIQAYGHMRKGLLEDHNSISIAPNQCLQDKGMSSQILHAMFRNERVYGKVVSIEGQKMTVSSFSGNQLHQIISQKKIRLQNINIEVANHFPNQCLSLQKHLQKFFKRSQSCHEETSRYRFFVNNFQDALTFYGFKDRSNDRTFGFTMSGPYLVSVGQHQADVLDGIGRLYHSHGITDGVFRGGVLNGIGVKYTKHSDTFTISQNGGNILKSGNGFPQLKITEIRKQFHLRSVYFLNEVKLPTLQRHLPIILKQLLSQICRHQEDFTKLNPNRQEEGKLQQKITLHPRLQKYELEGPRPKPKYDRNQNQYRTVANINLNVANKSQRVNRFKGTNTSSPKKPQEIFIGGVNEERRKKVLDIDKIYQDTKLLQKRKGQ